MVRKKEMKEATKINLVMDKSLIDELNKISIKSGVTRSRLIRIGSNLLVQLLNESYLDEEYLDKIVDEIEKIYWIDPKYSSILRFKNAKRQEKIDLVTDLYRKYTYDVISNSIDDKSDVGLLVYSSLGGKFEKAVKLIENIDNEDEAEFLIELLKKRKAK
jgi:ribosomal protein S25